MTLTSSSPPATPRDTGEGVERGGAVRLSVGQDENWCCVVVVLLLLYCVLLCHCIAVCCCVVFFCVVSVLLWSCGYDCVLLLSCDVIVLLCDCVAV